MSPALDAVVISLVGAPISKKSLYRRKKGGGLYFDKKIKAALDAWELQVPASARGLKLEHPRMDLFVRYENAASDRDGILATVLDLLQKTEVIVNDCIRNFNGEVVIHPAKKGVWEDPDNRPGVTVVLTPS